MLTLQKLRVYRKFDGQDYAWRSATGGHDESGITMDDWLLLAQLLKGFAYIRAGLVSPELKETIEKRLIASTADEETSRELWSYV